MDESRLRLQGIAYVPGTARGVVQRGWGHSGGIALLDGSKLEPVPSVNPPDACIVINGALLSHRMIGLATHGVPVVLLDSDQGSLLRPGMFVRVDGARGLVTDDPGTATEPPPPVPTAGQPVRLADGTTVWLLASVRGTAGARDAVTHGAGAIGLVRSEFLGADRSQPPDTTCYEAAFGSLCEAASPLRVTIRLLDLAADKPPVWLTGARELLCPLGCQGVRLFRREPVRGVIDSQLESLTVVREHHDFDLLIPFLGGLRD